MNTHAVGEKIARLRKQSGLTQKELAAKLSVSDKAVSKWENGMGYPEITLLPALSEIFGVSVDYLLKADSEGIAVAGRIIVDILNIIDKYPEKNMLANVLKISHAVGGCVSNTGIDLARIDPDLCVSAIGKVGNDENGRFVLSQMRKYGVNTEGVKIIEDAPTSTTNVMSEKTGGARTFFCCGGANSVFDVDDVDVDSLTCKIFHIGYILLLDALDAEDSEYGTRMARLLDKLSKKGIKTSIDVVSEDGERFREKILPALRQVDYVIMNEIECCRVTGLSPRNEDGTVNIANIEKTMREFIKLGVREKVIIHCPEAGFCLDKSGDFVVVPSLSLPEGYIKGTVGAGDAYAAACLYGLYKDWDTVRILEFASAASACNLSAEDSVSGMRPASEIDKLCEEYPRRVL